MAAAFELELDTTAPAITLEDDVHLNQGVTVTVPYAIDEPSLEGATLALGSTFIAARVEPDKLIFDLEGRQFAGGRVTATAVDSVGNASHLVRDYIPSPVDVNENVWSGSGAWMPAAGQKRLTSGPRSDDYERAAFILSRNRR